MNEEWKDIKEYEGLYQVSNLGNVRSLDRAVKDNNRNRYQKLKGKTLKYCDNGHGYKLVFLNKNSIRRNFYVHRLVAEAFIPNPNNYLEINHKNLDKNDNRVENLEWVTQLENKKHYHNTDFAKLSYKKISEKKRQKKLQQLNQNKERLIQGYTIENKTLQELNKETGIGIAKISNFLKQNGIKIDYVNIKKKRGTLYIPNNRMQWKKLERDKKGRFFKKCN